MVKLLLKWECAGLRDQYHRNEKMCMPEGIGPDPKIVISNGRSVCRICGQKIAKGEEAIEFCFGEEGNSWTACMMKIHLKDCDSPRR